MAENRTRPARASVTAFTSAIGDLMSKLGKYKTGKSCLFIKQLADIDEAVPERLIVESVNYMRTHYETR
jgi:hypothetical protein